MGAGKILAFHRFLHDSEDSDLLPAFEILRVVVDTDHLLVVRAGRVEEVGR